MIRVPDIDALVVIASVSNFDVRKILVDTSSLTDIILTQTFEHMKLDKDLLKP